MHNVLAKLILLCLFLVFGAPAAAQARCIAIKAALALIKEANARHRVLAADERARAVAIYNATPPVGTFAFEIALLVELPDGVGLLWFGNGAELCATLAIPPHGLPQMKQRIAGTGA
jgi:hypothetical protein